MHGLKAKEAAKPRVLRWLARNTLLTRVKTKVHCNIYKPYETQAYIIRLSRVPQSVLIWSLAIQFGILLQCPKVETAEGKATTFNDEPKMN